MDEKELEQKKNSEENQPEERQRDDKGRFYSKERQRLNTLYGFNTKDIIKKICEVSMLVAEELHLDAQAVINDMMMDLNLLGGKVDIEKFDINDKLDEITASTYRSVIDSVKPEEKDAKIKSYVKGFMLTPANDIAEKIVDRVRNNSDIKKEVKDKFGEALTEALREFAGKMLAESMNKVNEAPQYGRSLVDVIKDKAVKRKFFITVEDPQNNLEAVIRIDAAFEDDAVNQAKKSFMKFHEDDLEGATKEEKEEWLDVYSFASIDKDTLKNNEYYKDVIIVDKDGEEVLLDESCKMNEDKTDDEIDVIRHEFGCDKLLDHFLVWLPKDTIEKCIADFKKDNDLEEGCKMKEGYDDMTVGQLKGILQDALDQLDGEEDTTNVKLRPNTYRIGVPFLGTYKGYVDLNNMIDYDEEDDDMDESCKVNEEVCPKCGKKPCECKHEVCPKCGKEPCECKEGCEKNLKEETMSGEDYDKMLKHNPKLYAIGDCYDNCLGDEIDHILANVLKELDIKEDPEWIFPKDLISNKELSDKVYNRFREIIVTKLNNGELEDCKDYLCDYLNISLIYENKEQKPATEIKPLKEGEEVEVKVKAPENTDVKVKVEGEGNVEVETEKKDEDDIPEPVYDSKPAELIVDDTYVAPVENEIGEGFDLSEVKDAASLANVVAKRIGLSHDEEKMLEHDINNLRGVEWLDEVEFIGDEELVKKFKEIAKIEDEPEMNESKKLTESLQFTKRDIEIEDEEYIPSNNLIREE